MIKLFRKIRHNSLSGGKTRKYLKYALGEIILVVIGILIALQINNWNANRIKTKEEISLLKELNNAISKDIRELNVLYRHGKEDLVSASILINWLDNKEGAYHDSLSHHFLILSRTGLTKIFRPQNSTFKMLESRGIDLISNAKLKNKILDLYNIEYTHLNFLYDNYRKNIHDYGRPIARTEFKVIGKLADIKMLPNDYLELKANTELYNILKVLELSSHAINNNIKGLLEYCQRILIAIENEIQK